MVTLKAVVEALLFASQKPISLKEIGAALKLASDYFEEGEEAALGKSSEQEIAETLSQLQSEYTELNRAFQLVEQVAGWTLVSRSEYQVWVRQLFPEMRPTRLSAPALETLAIIAYRQPITKADIEAIRGVAVDGVMQKLLDGSLVKIAGRADVPGRPLLYETTQHFMEHFGLRTLDELPNASELRQLQLPIALQEEAKLKPLEEETEEPSPTDKEKSADPSHDPLEHAPVATGQPVAETDLPSENQ
jgi:segregation and condensation protein B